MYIFIYERYILINSDLFILFLFGFLFLGFTNSMNLYDNNISNVVNLNPKNFDQQIIKNRAINTVSIVHFYTLDGINNII